MLFAICYNLMRKRCLLCREGVQQHTGEVTASDQLDSISFPHNAVTNCQLATLKKCIFSFICGIQHGAEQILFAQCERDIFCSLASDWGPLRFKIEKLRWCLSRFSYLAGFLYVEWILFLDEIFLLSTLFIRSLKRLLAWSFQIPAHACDSL